MTLLARVVHPPSVEGITPFDQHPAEKHVSVDANGFLQVSPETSGFSVAEGVFKVASYVWDTDTLSWVRATQGTGGGGGVVVATPKRKKLDQASAETLYIGEADVGVATNSSLWRIRRITFSAGGDVLAIDFASGGASTSVWDNRSGLSYS